ncbi:MULTISPECIES: ABC transporter ATP-binding protein [unclassified Gemella]|uniref:ATP-binding cassette domain-containing protein n=1 Tax=unclassified Gemella TaxID=2624949 RepID=UPI001D1654BD|nr:MULTISPECIES: ABC transporter ATP-binding protein [unclassified Gemella]
MLIEQKGFANFYQIVTYVIETILAIIALLAFHWSIILFTLFSAMITLLFPSILNKQIEDRSTLYTKSLENFVSKNTNILQGFDVLLSFNKLNILNKTMFNTSNNILKTSVSLRKSLAGAAVLGGIGNVLSQLGIIALTGFLAIKNIVGFGSILTIEALSSTIFNSVGNIMNVSIELKTVNPIFKKINKYILESENVDLKNNSHKNFVEKINTFNIKNLFYTYGDKIIFNDFNYIFLAGNKYAILGESGSGKSTLFKLLTGRLDDYKGSIKLNNREVKDIKKSDLYNQIIYIAQDPYIFNDDIKFNITLGDEYDDDTVNNILKEVGLYDLVSNLEKGIYTKLEEGGRNLSGGQKQRISLARGLIRNKKILFLDEITSSQDERTSDKIEDLVLNNKELTVFMISHKLDKEKLDKFKDIIRLS